MNEALEKCVRIGTSGWSYPKGEGRWNGIFYPPKPKNELELYSQVFNTVEVNATFYRLIDPQTARVWVANTPKNFEFAIKIWQKFTHPGMFQKATGAEPEITQQDYDDFKRGIHPIAEECKLACLLIQFSEWFASTPQHQATLSTILQQFKDYPVAVELRHASWGDRARDTKALLVASGAGWAYIDMPQLKGTIKQELEPQRLLYLRFHGRNREKWRQHETAEERYDYLYSEEELKPFAEKVREIVAAGESKVLIFFNNHVRGQAPANALMLAHQIGLPSTATVRAEFTKAFPAINDAVKEIQTPEAKRPNQEVLFSAWTPTEADSESCG
ncbi:MAG: DUF72 domain-containing protein [Candidatus Methylomirabilis oxygeniifera]|uniref:DUF72 domain-containing protein n=1 Tax=Methylomirabilis oxygeniifera TaxID=671143 RepID=D5MJA2_METO1|nr:MAG: DUF72 domain-containing protein [Candidatus Methylomirabilis oxyfera]CBE67467.1 conserved protein of unknown function [Candidatus Methylomirabilis oxyfera]